MKIRTYQPGSTVTILEKKYVIPNSLEFLEKQSDDGEIIITVKNINSGNTKNYKYTNSVIDLQSNPEENKKIFWDSIFSDIQTDKKLM